MLEIVYVVIPVGGIGPRRQMSEVEFKKWVYTLSQANGGTFRTWQDENGTSTYYDFGPVYRVFKRKMLK